MTKSRNSVSGDSFPVFRLLGPPQDQLTHSSNRLDVFRDDFDELSSIWHEYASLYAESPGSLDSPHLLVKLNESQIGTLAVQLYTPSPLSDASISTFAFFHEHLKPNPDPTAMDPNTWREWLAIGIPEILKPIWNHRVNIRLTETMK